MVRNHLFPRSAFAAEERRFAPGKYAGAPGARFAWRSAVCVRMKRVPGEASSALFFSPAAASVKLASAAPPVLFPFLRRSLLCRSLPTDRYGRATSDGSEANSAGSAAACPAESAASRRPSQRRRGSASYTTR